VGPVGVRTTAACGWTGPRKNLWCGP